jgi:hypothetical protein
MHAEIEDFGTKPILVGHPYASVPMLVVMPRC